MSWSKSTTPLPKNWSVIRRRVLRGSDVCSICNQSGADEVDHVVPRYRGGTDEVTNLRPVHKSCHARKSASEGHERKAELRRLRRRPEQRHPGRV